MRFVEAIYLFYIDLTNNLANKSLLKYIDMKFLVIGNWMFGIYWSLKYYKQWEFDNTILKEENSSSILLVARLGGILTLSKKNKSLNVILSTKWLIP